MDEDAQVAGSPGGGRRKPIAVDLSHGGSGILASVDWQSRERSITKLAILEDDLTNAGPVLVVSRNGGRWQTDQQARNPG